VLEKKTVRKRKQPRKQADHIKDTWRSKILIYVLFAYKVAGYNYTEEDFLAWDKMPPLKLTREQKKHFVKICAKTFTFNKVMYPVFDLESTHHFYPYNNMVQIKAAYILLDLITKFINDDNIPKG
jgi:hypothetical protein